MARDNPEDSLRGEHCVRGGIGLILAIAMVHEEAQHRAGPYEPPARFVNAHFRHCNIPESRLARFGSIDDSRRVEVSRGKLQIQLDQTKTINTERWAAAWIRRVGSRLGVDLLLAV